MVDLAQWLTACLDEDERIARAAPAGPWWADSTIHTETINAGDGTTVIAGGQWGGEASVFESDEVAAHIVCHDPARVLREIDAKRKLVELHRPIPDPTPPFKDVDGFLCSVCTAGGAMYDQNRGVLFTDLTVFPCPTLRLLAAPYSDRPGFREEWAP